MKKILCIIQEHMFSKTEILDMEAGFREIYQDNYSQEKVNVLWMIMPKGYAYSERQESNAAVIMIEVDEDISKENREQLMALTSSFLLENFKISPLDSVITVANSSFVNSFLETQKKRVSTIWRPWINMKQLFSALYSKFKNGYLRLRVRY